jgi:hypothetical protein
MCLSKQDGRDQGCQMVCFQTKNPYLGKFWRVLLWKILVYFMTIWSILGHLEIFYGHLVYVVLIWYIFPALVFCTKKNLATQQDRLFLSDWFIWTKRWRWKFRLKHRTCVHTYVCTYVFHLIPIWRIHRLLRLCRKVLLNKVFFTTETSSF